MRDLISALREATGLTEKKQTLADRAPAWLHKKIKGTAEAAEVPGRGRGPGKGDPASCPRRKAGLAPLRKRLRRGGGGPPEGRGNQ